MTWVRSNIRHGARLALFAMLVQLALTFGHSHWFAQAAALTQSSLQLTDDAKAGASVDRAVIEKQSPAGPDREQPDEDNCAVCALVAMADTIVSATPPMLLLPQQTVRLSYHAPDAEFIHLQPGSAAFQPRAPPAS